MSDAPFIKFYPSDFLAGTSGLTPAERGVYITILCLIYEADGVISRDDARLSRRCGMPKAAFIRTIDALIDDGKLNERDGMISNKRAETALVDRRNRIQNATHAANSRHHAQRQKTEQNQQQIDAAAMPAQCVEDASQNQNQNQNNNTIIKDDRFDDFWAVVCRKVGKGQARKAWKAATKKADADRLISAMKAFTKSCEGKDEQYIPHPATWLNGERWDDQSSSMQSSNSDRPQMTREEAEAYLKRRNEEFAAKMRQEQIDRQQALN